MSTQTQAWSGAAAGARTELIARLGWACMAAALLTGVGQGAWEMARPILADRAALDAAPRAQLWAYGLANAIKSTGFLAGLYGFYLCATRRGPAVKAFMALATVGGLFFAAVWLWIAVTARFTIVYVLGGMWYQMIAPVALGVAALFARRVAGWKGAVFVVVGLLNAQIFPLLGPARANVVQGLIWLALGYVVYSCRDRAPAEATTK